MEEENYRLYINAEQLNFESFDKAKEEAKMHLSDKPELRIEILLETEDADFWAYEYEKDQWVPS